MKNSRTLTTVLGVALLGIWGKIGFEILGAVESASSTALSASMASTSDQEDTTSRFVYLAKGRDPFHYGGKDENISRARTIAVQPPPWTPPPLRLSGIVLKKGRSTAMLQSGAGATYFLHQGDTLFGARLTRISGQAVEYSYRKKKGQWVVEEK